MRMPPVLRAKAFSLIELLVVIALIAIVTAIAIPSIANITAHITKGKDQRNAQNIASLAAAAKAAGATNNLSTTDAITLLQPPGVVGKTAIAFSISPMSTGEQDGAAIYLSDNSDPNGGVIYNPAPAPTP